MLAWLRKREEGGMREGLLLAVVVRNALVREVACGEGVRLKVPVKGGGWWRKEGGVGAEKTFELDGLGRFVWEGIDGRRTVEGCIRRFAEEKRVNLREAEVAVLGFLKMLVRKGLIGMVVKGGE